MFSERGWKARKLECEEGGRENENLWQPLRVKKTNTWSANTDKDIGLV